MCSRTTIFIRIFDKDDRLQNILILFWLFPYMTYHCVTIKENARIFSKEKKKKRRKENARIIKFVYNNFYESSSKTTNYFTNFFATILTRQIVSG